MEQRPSKKFHFYTSSLANTYHVKKNFPNFIRIFIIGLTIIFIAGINVFFSSNVVNKHFHTSLTTEEIDGTTNTFTSIKSKVGQSRILNSIVNDMHSSTPQDPDTKRTIRIITPNKFFPELKRNFVDQSLSNVLPVRKAQSIRQKELDDIVITIKTTKKNHRSRLVPIIKTWFQYVPSHTYFITDEEDELISKITGKNSWIA